MKKITLALFFSFGLFVLLESCASTPKSNENIETTENTIVPKHNGILLDKKNGYSIEGVEIFSTVFSGGVINEDGEIICSSSYTGDWYGIGWQLRGYDLSKYAGLRFELNPLSYTENIEIRLSTYIKDECMSFKFDSKGVCYVLFNGSGQSWGNISQPKPENGFEINIWAKKIGHEKIKFTSIELINADEFGTSSDLSIMGNPFGSLTDKAVCLGKEIIWPKGTTDAKCGWNLSGFDLSKYDRIRIELETTDVIVNPRIVNKDWNNWHGFDENKVGPNIWEFNLSGDDASWTGDNAIDFDKTKGMYIFLQLWTDDKPTEQEYKTTVKSVQLLKGRKNDA